MLPQVTVAAYTLISYHLWGAGHIGAATHQQQLRRLASRRRTIKMLVMETRYLDN